MKLLECTNRWKKVRLGAIFQEVKEKNTNFTRKNAFKFTYGIIVDKKEYELSQDLIDIYSKYTMVDPNDIIINGLNLNYDFVTQRVAIVKRTGIITSSYISLRERSSEIDPQYYCYYFKAMDSCKMFHGMGEGIRLTLSYDELKGIPIAKPSYTEQSQIAHFLDWKISEINKLISIKKKQVSFYKELRKALIDEGILYGFKKSKSKGSGVYWLGNIPESWEILPLKRVCKVNASISDIVKTMDDSDLVTFIPMSSVSATGDADYSLKGRVADFRKNFSSFAKGDVVVAKITPCFENGKGACLDKLDTAIGFGTTEFINLRPTSRILSRYLYMITMTRPFRELGEKVMTGSAGQKRVPVNYIKNFTLGIPGIEEQKEILEKIDRKLEQVDELISAEIQSIKELQKLKTTLISDVVTGKIDVRNVEIPEYERVEKDFTEDDSSVMSEEIEKQED